MLVRRGQRTLARCELSRGNAVTVPPGLREADAATTTISLGAAASVRFRCSPRTPGLWCRASSGTERSPVQGASARVSTDTAPAVRGCIQNLVTIPNKTTWIYIRQKLLSLSFYRLVHGRVIDHKLGSTLIIWFRLTSRCRLSHELHI